MPIFESPNGIQLHLISPSGNTLAILSDTDRSGPILDAKVTDLKIGGVDTFSFRIAKDFTFPLSRNSECHFYVNSNLWFIGFITEVPLFDQNDPVLEIKGQGFIHRLSNKVISSTQTTQTLDTILKTILSANLGADLRVLYDVAKITTPSVTGLSVEYMDVPLLDVIDELLGIANFDYDNDRYRYYIDNENEFVFGQIPIPLNVPHFYEGYNFQAPEIVEDNSKLINKVLSFRATTLNPKILEFVSTKEDLASQANFGLFEKKIAYSSFVSTNGIDDIADAILARRSEPEIKLSIENFILGNINSPLAFGNYRISNRREKYRKNIYEAKALSWTTANLVNTTISLSALNVLTGKQSLEFSTTGSSAGDFSELTLPFVIPFPQLVRIFIFIATTLQAVRFTFFSAEGRQIIIPDLGDVGSVANEWYRRETNIAIETALDNFQVVTPLISSTPEDLELVISVGPVVTDTLEIRHITNPGILNIQKVRITIVDSVVAKFYVDLIDILVNNFSTHDLTLEQVDYELSSLGLFANIFFGDMDDNIFTEIGEKVEDGDIALGVVAKQ